MSHLIICDSCKEVKALSRLNAPGTLCLPCAKEFRKVYRQARMKAYGLLHRAIDHGKLSRPDTCELCNTNVSQPRPGNGFIYTSTKTFAHHWNGYDNPLDIWWVCASCNSKLRGPQYHNGSVTKAQARAITAPPVA